MGGPPGHHNHRNRLGQLLQGLTRRPSDSTPVKAATLRSRIRVRAKAVLATGPVPIGGPARRPISRSRDPQVTTIEGGLQDQSSSENRSRSRWPEDDAGPKSPICSARRRDPPRRSERLRWSRDLGPRDVYLMSDDHFGDEPSPPGAWKVRLEDHRAGATVTLGACFGPGPRWPEHVLAAFQNLWKTRRPSPGLLTRSPGATGPALGTKLFGKVVSGKITPENADPRASRNCLCS